MQCMPVLLVKLPSELAEQSAPGSAVMSRHSSADVLLRRKVEAGTQTDRQTAKASDKMSSELAETISARQRRDVSTSKCGCFVSQKG